MIETGNQQNFAPKLRLEDCTLSGGRQKRHWQGIGLKASVAGYSIISVKSDIPLASAPMSCGCDTIETVHFSNPALTVRDLLLIP